MSAIAAVAEFEDVVRETFVTEEFNDECKYTVRKPALALSQRCVLRLCGALVLSTTSRGCCERR
jgi:hypothetical protein